MAVAVGLSPFWTHLFESHTRRRLNSVRGRPGHSVPPSLQGFHPLGLVPQGDAGNPQQERFLLHSAGVGQDQPGDRKSTRLNSSHSQISYAVFCLKKKKTPTTP